MNLVVVKPVNVVKTNNDDNNNNDADDVTKSRGMWTTSVGPTVQLRHSHVWDLTHCSCQLLVVGSSEWHWLSNSPDVKSMTLVVCLGSSFDYTLTLTLTFNPFLNNVGINLLQRRGGLCVGREMNCRPQKWFHKRSEIFEYSVEQNVDEVVSMRGSRGVEIWEMGGRSRWMSWEVVFFTQHRVY